jgi:hypothetical protein
MYDSSKANDYRCNIGEVNQHTLTVGTYRVCRSAGPRVSARVASALAVEKPEEITPSRTIIVP